VICVSLTTINALAGLVPNTTAVAPVKLTPLITTLVPPAAGPVLGEMLVMRGRSDGASGELIAPRNRTRIERADPGL
jgi:hypothetical protein